MVEQLAPFVPSSGATGQKGTTMSNHDDLDAPEQLLTPSEVAAMFRVNPKTVTRWARAGKLTAIRTLGGHRRFKVSEIKRCLEEMSVER
jgi:excisionase family DNA binding protein